MTMDDHGFQERVDELLLLEQRASRRAEQFLALTGAYQEKNEKTVKDLLDRVGHIDESLSKINAASDSVNATMRRCATHASRAAKLFIGTIIGAVFIVAGTLWFGLWIKACRSSL